jgi:ribosomal protein L29
MKKLEIEKEIGSITDIYNGSTLYSRINAFLKSYETLNKNKQNTVFKNIAGANLKIYKTQYSEIYKNIDENIKNQKDKEELLEKIKDANKFLLEERQRIATQSAGNHFTRRQNISRHRTRRNN